jgi:phosphoribosylcarboxyaminoimidazole (NCAIR) mutase
MEQEPIQGNILKTAATVAGAGALLSPVGLPILQGLAGIAVAGIGIFAAGTAAMKAAEMIGGAFGQAKPPQEEDSPFL